MKLSGSQILTSKRKKNIIIIASFVFSRYEVYVCACVCVECFQGQSLPFRSSSRPPREDLTWGMIRCYVQTPSGFTKRGNEVRYVICQANPRGWYLLLGILGHCWETSFYHCFLRLVQLPRPEGECVGYRRRLRRTQELLRLIRSSLLAALITWSVHLASAFSPKLVTLWTFLNLKRKRENSGGQCIVCACVCDKRKKILKNICKNSEFIVFQVIKVRTGVWPLR